MSSLASLKNKLIAKVITRFPSMSKRFIDAYKPRECSGDVPWTPVRKALHNCRVALVTTSGVHHRDQKPFDMADKEGDPTFRVIDLKKPLSDLMITHDYYDHSDADKDINIVFPVERLREFQKDGIIGKLADTAYGFMGHIDGHHIDTLINKSAPEIVKKLKADNVDVVLLTPAWGICNQSVGLIQREIESSGIPTTAISIVREFTEKVKPPRTVCVKWPFGHVLGEPFNVAQQRAMLVQAFKALYTIECGGQIIDLPYKWKRENYDVYNDIEHAKKELKAVGQGA